MTGPERLRIGINLLWLEPGVVGGSEEATVAAIRGLRDLDTGDRQFVLFGRTELFELYGDLAESFEVSRFDLGTSKVRRILSENTMLASRVRSHGIDLVHHAGGVVPPLARGRSTVTIHDAQPLDLPANFSVAKRSYLGVMIRRSVQVAGQVMVPSQFVKDRLVDRFGTAEDRISVVPWSVAAVPAPGPDDVTRALRRYGIDSPFILYPAITYPHKNHAVLLDAFARVAAGTAATLVLTGGTGPCEAAVLERIARPDLSGRVVRTGRVPRPDLDTLMHAAHVVAVPSRYEGFGLPALEAMQTGRPTVVSSCGSLPEVTGGAAIVVGPDDVAGWADSLQSLLSDPGLCDRLSVAGRSVAASFDPARTASALVMAFDAASDR